MNICALFKTLQSGGNYFNLSQYTEDLIISINNGIYVVKPTSFICANIKGSDELTLDSNILPKYLQNYYENSCSLYRNSGGIDNIFLTKLKDTLDKFNTEYVYYGEVTLYSSNNVDGTAYNEVYCYLSPNASKQTVDISGVSSDSITSEQFDERIQGYQEDGYYKGVSYSDDEDADGSIAIYDSECTYTYSKYSGITTESDSEDPDSFTFNTIILLYNVYDESDNIIMENIPMGIYFTGDVNNKIINNEICKYVRNDDIYGQGSSWGIRISNKLLSTVNTQEVYTSFSEDIGGERAVFAEALDNLVNLTSTIEEKSQETQLSLQTIKASLSTIQTAQTNVPYIVDVLVDGETVPMWFINGMNTSYTAKGDDGGTVEVYNMTDILSEGETWSDIQSEYQNGKSIILDDTDEDYLYLRTYTNGEWNEWDIKGTAGKMGEPGYSLNVSKEYKTLTIGDTFLFDYNSDGEAFFGTTVGTTNDAIFTSMVDSDGVEMYIYLYIYNEDTGLWNSDGLNFKGGDGPQGETGTGIQILGSANNASELPNSPNQGDSYIVAGSLWVWTIVNDSGYWLDCGSIVGPQGETGPQGSQGVQGVQGLNFHLTDQNVDGTRPDTTSTTGTSICIDKYGDVYKYNSGVLQSLYGNVKGQDGKHGTIIRRAYQWADSKPSITNSDEYEYNTSTEDYEYTIKNIDWYTDPGDTEGEGKFLFTYESVFEVDGVDSSDYENGEIWDEESKTLTYIYKYKNLRQSPVTCIEEPITYSDETYTLNYKLNVPSIVIDGESTVDNIMLTSGSTKPLSDYATITKVDDIKSELDEEINACVKNSGESSHGDGDFTFNSNNVLIKKNITICDLDSAGEGAAASLVLDGNINIGDDSNFFKVIDAYNGTFDKVITTQEEFDELVSSVGWLGAKSVAFVGTPLYKGSPIIETDEEGNYIKEVVEVKSIAYDDGGYPILDSDGNLTYNIEKVDTYVYETDVDGNVVYTNATYPVDGDEEPENIYGFVYTNSNLIIPNSVTTIQGFRGAKIYVGSRFGYGYDYDGDVYVQPYYTENVDGVGGYDYTDGEYVVNENGTGGYDFVENFYDYEKCRSISDLKIQYLNINKLTNTNINRGSISLFKYCSNLNNCEAIVDNVYDNTKEEDGDDDIIVNLYDSCTSVNNCWGTWSTSIGADAINIYNNCDSINHCSMFRSNVDEVLDEYYEYIETIGFNNCKNIKNNICTAFDIDMDNFTLYDNCSDIKSCYHDYEKNYFTTFAECDNIDSCEGSFVDCTRVRFSTGLFDYCYVDESSTEVSSGWSGGCNKIITI